GWPDQVGRAMGAPTIPPAISTAIAAAERVAAGTEAADPAHHALMERHALASLATRLAAAGLSGEPNSREPLADAAKRLVALPRLAGLAQSLIGLLSDAGALRH